MKNKLYSSNGCFFIVFINYGCFVSYNENGHWQKRDVSWDSSHRNRNNMPNSLFCYKTNVISAANIINSMEQSPSWEADDCSAGKRNSPTSVGAEVYYLVHNSPPLDPILNQINLVHTFNIILSFKTKFSKFTESTTFEYHARIWCEKKLASQTITLKKYHDNILIFITVG
jgi:hypothetical protein